MFLTEFCWHQTEQKHNVKLYIYLTLVLDISLPFAFNLVMSQAKVSFLQGGKINTGVSVYRVNSVHWQFFIFEKIQIWQRWFFLECVFFSSSLIYSIGKTWTLSDSTWFITCCQEFMVNPEQVVLCTSHLWQHSTNTPIRTSY